MPSESFYDTGDLLLASPAGNLFDHIDDTYYVENNLMTRRVLAHWGNVVVGPFPTVRPTI